MFDSPIPAVSSAPAVFRPAHGARRLSLSRPGNNMPAEILIFIIPYSSRPCNKLSVKQILRNPGLFEVFRRPNSF